MLIAKTCRQLVVTGEEGEVIGNVRNLVLHTVVVGEQLVTGAHVRFQNLVSILVLACHDVDEGERRRIGAAHVLYIGVGEQQLIGNLIGEAAVQICRPRLHLVVHGIHAVGKRHRLCTYAVSIVQAISRIGRVAVRGIPSRILRIVVAEAQAMAVRDVPVDAGQQLGVLLVGREIGVGACIIAVFVLQMVVHLLHVRLQCTGHHTFRIFTVLARAILYNLSRSLLFFVVHKEEQLVLDDGTTQREAVGSLGLIGTCSQVLAVDAVTAHVLVAVIGIGSTSECVRTTLGDGIDAAADEVRLAYVERGDNYLHFFDGIHRDGISATGKVGTQSEVVVEVGTVDGEVRGTSVTSGKAHAVGVGRKAGDVADTAVHGRELRYLCRRDVGSGTRLFGGKLGLGSRHNHFVQQLGRFAHLYVQVIHLAQLESDVLINNCLIADIGNLYPIGTTGAHTLDGIASVDIGHGSVARTGRLVHRLDSGTNNGLITCIRHLTRHRSCGDLRIYTHGGQ